MAAAGSERRQVLIGLGGFLLNNIASTAGRSSLQQAVVMSLNIDVEIRCLAK